MYSIDANILIYTAIKDSPHYEKSRKFLEHQFKSYEPCYLCWEVVFAFVRILTNHQIMTHPMSFEEANDRISRVLNLPQVNTLTASKESWQVFSQYHKQMPIKGNLVTDAVIASILESNGIKKIYSNDRDFWKFAGLKPVNPITLAVDKRRP